MVSTPVDMSSAAAAVASGATENSNSPVSTHRQLTEAEVAGVAKTRGEFPEPGSISSNFNPWISGSDDSGTDDSAREDYLYHFGITSKDLFEIGGEKKSELTIKILIFGYALLKELW
jgi:hypothetical protein